MNILIFVMTMLMLLSLMTYARLESYRNSQSLQMIFKDYMEEKERFYINQGADKAYEKIKIPKPEKTSDDTNTETPSDGTKTGKPEKQKKAAGTSPKIGIKLLLDPKRDAQSKEWDQTQILLKKLMRNLYKEHPFYKDIEDKRPSFLDDLLRDITHTIDLMPPDKRPKTAKDLSNLRISDPILDDFLYKMLHGALYSNALTGTKNQDPSSEGASEDKGEAVVDENDSQDEIEYQSPTGYYSLLDFVTEKHTPKIRVYLAPQDVLQAVFNDPATVLTIMSEREQLFKRADANEDVNALEESFKNQFLRLKDPEIEDDSLNFSVSKTNPKYYR